MDKPRAAGTRDMRIAAATVNFIGGRRRYGRRRMSRLVLEA